MAWRPCGVSSVTRNGTEAAPRDSAVAKSPTVTCLASDTTINSSERCNTTPMITARTRTSNNGAKFLVFACLCGGILFTTGSCNEGAKRLSTAVVTGRVTLDGKPLPSGTVTFIPNSARGTTGPTGVGLIDEDGYYRIVTAGQDGAVVGHHRLKVLAVDSEQPGRPWITPEKYNNPKNAGLSAEVKAGKENVVDLPLRSNP